MSRNTIIGIRRGNMFSVYLIALVGVTLLLAILHYIVKFPLEKLINPLSLIPISVLLIAFTFGFLKFIDKKPMLIVSDSGISMRKSRLPFSGLKHIDWSDVESYSAKVEQFRNGATKFLVIKQRSSRKKYYVDLFDLKTDNGEILSIIKRNLNEH